MEVRDVWKRGGDGFAVLRGLCAKSRSDSPLGPTRSRSANDFCDLESASTTQNKYRCSPAATTPQAHRPRRLAHENVPLARRHDSALRRRSRAPRGIPGRAAATPPPPPQVQNGAPFDASKLETPESIAIDRRDNIFLSMALTGEIPASLYGTQTTHAVLPVGPPLTSCGPFIGIQGAIALIPHGNIYAALASCIEGD